MSIFIQSMPLSVGFRFRPPESNVMPFPTNAIVRFAPGGSYRSSIRRGGFGLPRPTPRIPPNPFAASSFSFSTFTFKPLRAILRASCASDSGLLSPAGVFVRSRARFVPSATAAA